jgi:hypothetical protein
MHWYKILLTNSKQQKSSWKLIGFQLVKKFPTFYETQRFLTAFTSTRHLSLSRATLIQSMPSHPTSCSSIYAWVFQMASFPQVSPPEPSILSSIHATCPTHLILLNLITWTIFGEQYRVIISWLCSFLHSHVTSSLLGPNILLNTLISNTLSLHSSRSVSDQVSHPYTTTGKIIVYLNL